MIYDLEALEKKLTTLVDKYATVDGKSPISWKLKGCPMVCVETPRTATPPSSHDKMLHSSLLGTLDCQRETILSTTLW